MRLFKVLVCILLSLFCAVPLYAEDPLNRLADVSVQALDGKVLVRLSSEQPVGYRYTVYDSIDPVRVVVDFPRMEMGEIKSPVMVGQGGVQEIRFSTFELSLGTLVRAEILLDEQTAYKVDFKDNAMTLAFNQPQDTQPQPANQTVAVASDKAVADKAAADKAAADKAAADKAAADKAAADKAAADKAAADKAAADKAAADKAAADKAAADKAAADKAAADKAAADKAAAIKAENVSSAAVKVGRNQVDIEASAGFSRLKFFELETPKRLVVDLFGVELADRIMKYDLDGGFTQLRVGPYADKLRFVFDSEKGSLPTYKVQSAENNVHITWTATESEAATVPPAVSSPAPEVVVPAQIPIAKTPAAKVTKIDFSSRGGSSVYRIEVDGPISLLEPIQEGTIVKFGLKNTTISRALSRVYASFAFPTAVQSVTPYQVIEGQMTETRFVVQLKGPQPYRISKEAGAVLLTVEDGRYAVAEPVREEERVLAVNAAAPPASPVAATIAAAPVAETSNSTDNVSDPIITGRNDMDKNFAGEKISLVFDNAEVRNILQLIAEVSDLNIIASDEIKGNVTLRLIDVPWDQALTLVLDITNLGMIREGNVVRVLPKGTIRSMREAELAADRAQEKLEPVQTEVISVSYADLKAVVGPAQKLLSDRGSMTEDARNKLVIVTDVSSRIEKVRELIKILDTPERQVMIEARIVEVNSNFSRDLGVNWGINYANPGEKMGAGSIGIGGDFLVGLPSGPGSTALEAGLGAGFTYGRIGIDQTILDLRLSALEANGNAKVISTPRVTTLNGEEATISQGTTIPYQTSGADGPKTEFVNANLELKVKPVINPDGSVILEILATNDTPSITAGASAPSIDTKKAETKVLVMDGETTVIGGIFVDTKQVSDSGVPYLGSLPLLGQLFRSDKTVQTKAELMIFITPRILNNN
jgi:type IV pilus assembly protein PilQ